MDGPVHVPVDTATAAPPRSILKKKDSHDCDIDHRPCSSHHKSGESERSRGAQWDEMNILATYHPPGKDYGHMKIDDPPTPYHEYDQELVEDVVDSSASTASVAASSPNPLRERKASFSDTTPEMLNSEVLANKLANPYQPKASMKSMSSDSDEERELNDEDAAKQNAFKSKRKEHYNEFQAVKMARQLLAEEEDDDGNDEEAMEYPV
ncbi:protein phosphatase inhibitor 2-like [Watersipora subatra]|uniref:protein phosphatase inhibitor 2-like n=1 Tax=Watersipora subatra TaxID=2589382 RepID=UPI00355ACFE6